MALTAFGSSVTSGLYYNTYDVVITTLAS